MLLFRHQRARHLRLWSHRKSVSVQATLHRGSHCPRSFGPFPDLVDPNGSRRDIPRSVHCGRPSNLQSRDIELFPDRFHPNFDQNARRQPQ